MGEITSLLEQVRSGSDAGTDDLLALVYNELRNLASVRMSTETADHTLTATALVHEAYLRLLGKYESANWNDRSHFFAAAAEAMRRILVERARLKQRRRQLSLNAAEIRQARRIQRPVRSNIPDVLEIDEALSRFAVQHPEKAEIVKLRYFAGLSMPEASEVLGISLATANRHWAYARAWLSRELRPLAGDSPGS